MSSGAMRMSSSSWSTSNGYNAGSRASSSALSSANGGMKGSSSRHANKITIVYDAATALKRKSINDLTHAIYNDLGEIGFIKLVEWIRSERLSSLPHQGSTWDTVLIRSLHVAERLHKFETSIQAFAAGSNFAAELAYSHIRLLLQQGHENSKALDKVFGLFYRCSLAVNSLLDRSELLSASSEIQEELCKMYTELVTLIVESALYFRNAASITSSGQTHSFDMYQVFETTLQAYTDRRERISNLIWSSQIETLGGELEEVISIDELSRWLSPQDRVINQFGSDHTIFSDELAEYTGLWFQESLIQFVKGSDECLLLNGPSGSGKTTLGSTIMERLQRPIARQTYQSVFVTIGANPVQATSLHLVKSVLHQLLSNRIGNLKLYKILVNAHQEAQRTADPEAYETHLWNALGEVLQNPLESANPTILIVDGLDEIKGKQAAGQKLLERLTIAIGRGKRTKLIAFSQNLTLPKSARGKQRQILPDETRDDTHAVVLRGLARTPHFTKTSGPEQETIITSIVDASQGNFTWAVVLCEYLQSEKAADAFQKMLSTIKSAPPSVSDLVLKLLTTLQPGLEACLILTWLTVAARPLTIAELSALLTVNVEKGELSNPSTNVHSVVNSVRPLISISHEVVRTRHGLITESLQKSLQGLIDQGKIPLVQKNSQVDLLLRSFVYAKKCLPDTSAPTLDMSDLSLPARLFPRHDLLEYVIRYWPYHLEQTPFSPGTSGSPKLPDAFKHVFPASTAMPILEYMCWDEQYPGSLEVTLHTTGYRLRTEVFSQNHPSVMQGIINTALYYAPMGNDKEASHAYYTATLIGQTVLKPSHPITVSCANSYLEFTSTMTQPSRTDVMTQREKVLKILIIAYQTQFGMTSDMVVSTQQQLLELYQYIKEESNATVIQQTLDEYNGSQTSHRPGTSRMPSTINGGMDLHIKSTRDTKEHKASQSGILVDRDDEDEDVYEKPELSTIIAQLQGIKGQDFEKAQATYIDLWSQLSAVCATTLSAEWHKQKIETVNAYAQALASSNHKEESTAILTAVAQEYSQHELSYSHSIVASLTQSAHLLQKLEHYTAAHAIFKQSASYYQSTHREKTKEVTEVEEMLAISAQQVERQVHKQLTTASDNSVTQSSLESVFYSAIVNHNQKIEASTVSMAATLVQKHMQQRQYEKAIEVVQATLQRTWSSFMAESLQSLTLSAAFLEENLALAEQLVQAYMQSHRVEKAMDIYYRLYRAFLTVVQKEPKRFEFYLNKLLSLYDRYGHFAQSISVLQEVLPVYANVYGANHEKTTALLYNLGVRCRSHARTHPYWIEYYQQIVKAMTKEGRVTGSTALDALKIVAVCYWEERRYVEATAAYGLLWTTLVDVQKTSLTKEDAVFLQSLHQQYVQCLEATQADAATLYKVTKQYQATCVAVFGASHEVSVEATQALTQISLQSEQSETEATNMLQQAYNQASSSSSSRELQSSETRDMRQQLIQMVKRRVTKSSSSAESVQQLQKLQYEEYQSYSAQQRYRSETALSSFRELAITEFSQEKTQSAAREQITQAISQVNSSKEEFSQEQTVQNATTIASILQASKQTSYASELLQELRLQIVAGQKRTGSSMQFDVTKPNKTALIFLATLEYQLRKDMSLTQSDIYFDLLSERNYYLRFVKVMNDQRVPLDEILKAAAPLRFYLQKRSRTQQVQSLEQQIVGLFVQRDLQGFSLEAKNTSPTIFITSILDYLGTRRNLDNTKFVRAVILSTNRTLRKLVDSNKQWGEAYDVAKIGFTYAKVHKGYRGAGAISSGFALASYLDGRGENRCPDETLRKKLLQLSNEIVREILNIAKEQDIDLAQVDLLELNELIALLGEQGDWETLESLLSQLWNTKKAQSTWPSDVLLRLGSRLIAVRYLAGHPVKAIRLCEDIAYNLRRTHGNADPATLQAYNMLVQLYTSTGQMYAKSASSDKTAANISRDYFKKAVLLEEDMLRRFASEGANGEAGEDDDEEDTAAAILAEHGVNVNGSANGHVNGEAKVDRSAEIKQHMRLLKLSYQRLGQWPKPFGVYEQLNANIYRMYGDQLKGVEGVEKWQSKGFGGGKAESGEGAFEAPKDWDIVAA